MRFPALLLAALLCVAVSGAKAAGVRFLDMPADADGPAMTGMVWYPCAAPPTDLPFGRTTLRGTKGCPVTGDALPLVVVSHGFGGKLSSHHDTTEALADAGFVVAAINHPIDSGPDMSRADTIAALTERPKDIKRLIDYMLNTWPDHAKLDPGKIGFFGFSRGGYTGLVLIGGSPDLRRCLEAAPASFCDQARDNPIASPGSFTHDPRIKAAVIADPAWGPMFTRDGLKDVKAPVQLWASELSSKDRVEVTRESVAAVGQNLPVRPESHLVANAGHFAFLTPCSPALAEGLPRLCTDPPGFDRVAFHKELDADIVTFFRDNLSVARN
ncbi:MAG: dienelactone hydrolase family protein [Acetobacteraceae bacterium]